MPIQTTRRRRHASRKRRTPSPSLSALPARGAMIELPLERQGKMRKMCLILMVGLGLSPSLSFARAEDQGPQPVVVQVSVGEPSQPSPACCNCAPVAVDASCCPTCAPKCALFNPQNTNCESCRSWLGTPNWHCLCQWLSYKPLPVPCECQCKCCCGCTGTCWPPVYAFFLRTDCCCPSCGCSPCQQGCGCGSH